ncbi:MULTISPECIES: helix-hairpin-helix domain-containing protein [Neobacillus]|uniref:Helix-hairpin-helix domain-containing protein n=1 Tax=Neobacillus sedimentimangrovi TaxID=2699460 RepID=A0ABS8QHK3_9BACI|nr:helix-hairpin-helix domain-containing protein [Neobacillus sedimentimangrovi]MCD4838557.1 helix-hairpin-helix domain-containing protein [Neobacillus sedimentimangrovi]
MKDWLMGKKYYVVAVVFIVLFGVYYFTNNFLETPLPDPSQLPEKKFQNEETEESTTELAKASDHTEVMMVDVKGQVKLPGVYQANEGERVVDIISRAGGLTELADETKVNLAEHVQDAMVIYIPAKGEEDFVTPGSKVGRVHASGGLGSNEGKININTADESELQKIPGIGPSKAAAIMEYRETNGPFQSAEDLKNISGIGEKTFEKLKDAVTVR